MEDLQKTMANVSEMRDYRSHQWGLDLHLGIVTAMRDDAIRIG